MNKINFTNLPSETTPVNANNLNTMQDNIEAEMGTKVSQNLETYTGDLNDVKTTGFTYARGTATNIPVSGHFFYVTTIAISADNVYQKATRLIEDLNLMFTYERQCVSGTWTEWRDMSAPTTVTNDNGTAIKFPDGTMICYNRINIESIAVTMADGALYRSSLLIPFNDFPVSFVGLPSVSIDYGSSEDTRAAWVVKGSGVTTANVRGFYLYCATSRTVPNARFSYIAIGRWK